MRYPSPHSSVLLTSTGTWSFVVIAICACCAVVGFLRRSQAVRGNQFARASRVGRRENSSTEDPQIIYRRGSPLFRWDQVGLEHLRAAERPADIPSV
jgi:hypothetical protein